MKNTLLLLPILMVVGCATPHTYIDPIDPNVVTVEQLADKAESLEEHYQEINQVEGIVWEAYRTDTSLAKPDRYGKGGDSCIFTGHKLAIDVLKYSSTKTSADLDKVLQSLRGLYILTHITGTPGVFCRNAFPAARASEWGYPEAWGGRDSRFVHTSSGDIADPFNPGTTFAPMTYYTRATKDQLTGLLFGLTVAWKNLEAADATHASRVALAREIVSKTTEDVYNHLRNHDFAIRDENGENDTNADSVTGLMRLQLLSLFKETVKLSAPHRASRIQEKYEDEFCWAFNSPGDLFNRFNNYQQYYAWNLRYLRTYSIFQFEDDSDRQKTIKNWMRDRLWVFTGSHLNSKFIYLYNAVTDSGDRLDDALFALKSLSLKSVVGQDSPLAGDERKPSLLQVLVGDWDRFVVAPHLRKPTSYTTWQKEPWDVGSTGHTGVEDATGIDFMLAYWLGRNHGYIAD